MRDRARAIVFALLATAGEACTLTRPLGDLTEGPSDAAPAPTPDYVIVRLQEPSPEVDAVCEPEFLAANIMPTAKWVQCRAAWSDGPPRLHLCCMINDSTEDLDSTAIGGHVADSDSVTAVLLAGHDSTEPQGALVVTMNRAGAKWRATLNSSGGTVDSPESLQATAVSNPTYYRIELTTEMDPALPDNPFARCNLVVRDTPVDGGRVEPLFSQELMAPATWGICQFLQ